MDSYRIEVSVAGAERSTGRYYIEAADADTAKADALARWKAEILPQLVIVSWEGPIQVLKATAAGSPATS